MKVLKNRKLDLPLERGSDKKGTYVVLCRNCLHAPPGGGFDVKLMAARIKVLDVLDGVEKMGGEEIVLEDAVAETLQSAVEAMRWARIERDLITFTEDVKNMESPADEAEASTDQS